MPASPSTATADGSNVVLEHWLFRKLEGIRFHLNPGTNQPGISVTLAKNEAFLTLASIRKEFEIDPSSADGLMLNKIAEALKYVKGLMLGDPLPSEVLTGAASWKIKPHQLAIAHQKIAMKLVTLVTGDRPTTTDPELLLKLAEDPDMKRKVNEAFGVAAAQLGLAPDRKQDVVTFVDQLAGELGYIEALREKFAMIDRMREKVQVVRKLYSAKPAVWDTSDQVARLIERARNEYSALFKDIDQRTADIMAMLRTLDSSIAAIRAARDDLHVRFLAWDDLLKEWSESQVEFSMRISDLLKRTHQFLAPRFMSFTDWTKLAREELKLRKTQRQEPMAW